MLLQQLAERHDLTLLALAWNADDLDAVAEIAERGIDTHVVWHGRAQRLRGLLGDPRRPLQQIASTSPRFAASARELIQHAADTGRPFAVAHVEHLRGASAIALPRPLGVRVVYDAVDCIADLARLTRANGPSLGTRLISAYEQPRTARLEQRLVAAADAVTVVAERDRLALAAYPGGARVVVVPNGVEALERPAPTVAAPRAIFTGKLSYHANQAALRWLLSDIWPRVRQQAPAAELLVAGANPPRWLRRADGADGVMLVERPRDMLFQIAQARLALAPMVYSVGIQNKILEAMACGVPVVATSAAAAGLPGAADGCYLTADDAEAFAASVVTLFRDHARAWAIGSAGHAYVRRELTWRAAADAFEALYLRAASQELAA
jgi:glycosyltransferase involved in cell wall biosynthesis